jgi:glycosyltransferase involved in cell wall biosynthesis
MPPITPEPLPAPSAPGILRSRTRSPRILYISPHWPHRATGASELRALKIAQALQAFGHVEVVVIDGEGRAEREKRVEHHLEIAYSVPVQLRANESLREKVRWVVDPRFNYPHGCGVNDQAMQRVLRTAKDFDLIWFSKLRTPNMFPRWEWPRSVADIDDVPSTYDRSILQNTLSVQDRVSAFVRFLSWKRRDRLLGERFTVLGVCSETDKQYLQSLGVSVPLHVIPNGSERPAAAPVRNRSTPPRLGFMGIFDYEPNLTGIQWFVRECWPRIREQVPDVQLRLAGRDSDGPSKPAGPGIEGLGWVSDLGPEVSTWAAMIVPIRIGAGTRGKISHAFSLKCPVVSTTLGAYGYDATDGDVMRLADSAHAFSDACVGLIREPAAADAMAERAWQAFLERWTWDAIRPRIWAAAEDCLRRSDEMSAQPGTKVGQNQE